MFPNASCSAPSAAHKDLEEYRKDIECGDLTLAMDRVTCVLGVSEWQWQLMGKIYKSLKLMYIAAIAPKDRPSQEEI